MTYPIVVYLLLIPCLVYAIPTRKDEDNSILSRVVRDVELTRSVRQSNTFQCQNEGQNGECVPEGVDNIPTSLVNCVAGQCVCNMCFMRNSSSGRCRTCMEYPYSRNQSLCGFDSRPKQLTAFLLSFFLSSTGAANFYIGQNSLAGGQLFLLLLTFACSYFMCCLPCCLACCLSKDDMKGSVFFIVFMIFAVLIVICVAIALWAWWIADLIIFATNQRLSGSGCELNANL